MQENGPNAEQIQYWNETAGPKWVAMQGMLDVQLESLGRRAMDAAGLIGSERVLDVGCGCGTTTIELAGRVPTGSATGADISAVMLDRGRERAKRAGVSNVSFENADAQTHCFETGAADVIYSRFGVMFFQDPPAAFSNLHRALLRSGRLSFICWRGLPENPWMLVPLMAAAQHITLPAPPAPDAPGPFAFADAGRVRGILDEAGFTRTSIEPVDETLTVGGTIDLDETVRFLLQMGPAAQALRDTPQEIIEKVAAAVRASLEPFYGPEGVRMPAAAWLVTARNE